MLQFLAQVKQFIEELASLELVDVEGVAITPDAESGRRDDGDRCRSMSIEDGDKDDDEAVIVDRYLASKE